MRRVSIVAVAVVSVLAVALPSSADPVAYYFHCQPARSTPVNNVNLLTDGNNPTFNTTPPAGSYTDGTSGCFAVGNRASSSGNYQGIYDFNGEGEHVGDIDSLTIRLYVVHPGPGETGAISGRVKVGINGKSMFGTGACTPGPTCPASKSFSTTTTSLGNGISVLELSVTQMAYFSEEANLVQVTVNNVTDPATLFLLDTVEAPSSIVINPDTLASTVVVATTPGV